MKPLLGVVFLFVVAFGTACGRSSKHAAADPAALKNSFENSSAELKAEADKAASSLNRGDALGSFESLSRLQQEELTREQQMEAGRAMVETLRKLHEASEKGDARAEEALNRHRMSK